MGSFFTDELGAYKYEEQAAADILLLGRRTYESFYGAWPLRDGPMADKINTMTKYVVSSTLGSSEWQNTTVIADDVEDAVGELKASDGGPILVAGSRMLAQSLLAAGLVDELNLQVFPLLLGSGDRLYPETPDKRPLRLVSSRALEQRRRAPDLRGSRRSDVARRRDPVGRAAVAAVAIALHFGRERVERSWSAAVKLSSGAARCPPRTRIRLVPGIGTIQGRRPSSQASATCRACRRARRRSR